MSGIISLILGTAGNLAMFGVFLAALRLPAGSSHFLLKGGRMIFFFEFIGLHASGIFAKPSKPKRRRTRVTLLAIYAVFALGAGIVFQNWFLPGYFAAGTVIKALERRAVADPRRIGLSIIALILSTFLAAFIGGAALIAVWGLSYFPALIAIDIGLFLRKKIPLNAATGVPPRNNDKDVSKKP